MKSLFKNKIPARIVNTAYLLCLILLIASNTFLLVKIKNLKEDNLNQKRTLNNTPTTRNPSQNIKNQTEDTTDSLVDTQENTFLKFPNSRINSYKIGINEGPVFVLSDKEVLNNLYTTTYLHLDWVYKDNFPKELSELNLNSVMRLNCSPVFYPENPGKKDTFYSILLGNYSAKHLRVRLEDDELLNLIRKKNLELESKDIYIESVQICETEEDRKIIFLKLPGSNGYHIQYLNQKDYVEIQEDVVFFGCSETPTAYTNNEELFITCGAGDYDWYKGYLFKINLNEGKKEKILECQTKFDHTTKENNVTCYK